MSLTAGAASISREKWPGVIGLCFAQFLAVLDGLIVSVALPSISEELLVAPHDTHWLLNAYLVTFAGLLPLGGRLADLLGRRTVFLAGQSALMIGSVLGALAGSLTVVLAGRVLQAVGAATSSPARIALAAANFPERGARARVFGLLTLGGGFGWAAAGLFGGLLTEHLGWRSTFLVNVPICLVAMALVVRSFPGDRPARGSRGLDWVGAFLALGCLGTLVYSLGRIEQVGLLAAETLLGVTVAGVFGVLFVSVEHRIANPLLRLALLTRGGVPGAVLLGLVLPVGFVATQFLGTVYLQEIHGLAADMTGYVFLALALMPVLATPIVTRHFQRLGIARSVSVGFLLATLGLGLLAWTASTVLAPAAMIPGFMLVGIGVTIVYVPLAVASVTGVHEDDYGGASATFASSQQVGASTALALISTLALIVSGGSVATETAYGPAGVGVGFAIGAGLCLLGALAAIPLLGRLDRGSANEL